jgi:hypothetical protein
MNLIKINVNCLKKNKPTVFERRNYNDGDSPKNGALRYELLLAETAERISKLKVLIHIQEFENVLMAVGWRVSEIIKGELK